MLNKFIKIDNFSKLLSGFVKINTWIYLSYKWICQNLYMDFSKLLHGCVKIVFIYFADQNQAEV